MKAGGDRNTAAREYSKLHSKCSEPHENGVMEVWTQLFITLILTIIMCHIGNVDHDIMITLTLSEHRMNIYIYIKKCLLTKVLVCKMSVMPPKHTPKKIRQGKTKTCLLRVISQVDEIFKKQTNKQTKNS